MSEEKAKSIIGAKNIAGDDLKAWSDRAKSNSYHCNKDELKHKLGGEGAASDLKINEAESPTLKPYQEGDGWAKPVNPEAVKNVYGGKGKSQRD